VELAAVNVVVPFSSLVHYLTVIFLMDRKLFLKVGLVKSPFLREKCVCQRLNYWHRSCN
jgi:hypothetical protein